ncbi:rho family-interacting cell polarization regulator 1 isoform X3 [Erpetoichthys calabaricus]|uniref:rho family-interacting cell polarization regulator 1 isoform X3 n=1 Tax=Erpetoichthys calabaricus TaxID=27687 RepID=UPI002233F9BA|nr:rho family-interacting cell polarization regulator 1 isoform X3 [Erpetoichthys calabaricus]
MYSSFRGSPSRAVSTMSLSVRPCRRHISSITRSQSFAGVNSSQDKPYRTLAVFSTPNNIRKPSVRTRRMFGLSHKSPPPKIPQPERLDEVYEALKRGLQSYLQVHQLELDNLTRQMRESKRNSRLGFLYELDKQVKSIERFMRRLEFHLSKIDELYEAYCMKRRLRDGANKMVKAYTASPGSKEARESLAEANKGYREYTESMCILENELENQLGEFHVKMKGLAGFARLCAGDQYEIFMKYGRQRWKLRGRIEVNGKQVWDSEEMVFLPLITEFLSIKVTELKSLANHVVVGNVSCETKDLFAALPQTVAVDINDLGTIKLSLEVTWNPFDKDDQSSAASTVNKSCTVNKRFSTYNQSPPDTPSLREQAFYNMLRRQDEIENGTAWSNSSESSDDSSSPQLSVTLRHNQKALVQPEIQTTAPAIEISFVQREESDNINTPLQDVEETQIKVAEKTVVANGHVRYSRSLSHISETSIDGAVVEVNPSESDPTKAICELEAVSVTDILMDMSCTSEVVVESQMMDTLPQEQDVAEHVTSQQMEYISAVKNEEPSLIIGDQENVTKKTPVTIATETVSVVSNPSDNLPLPVVLPVGESSTELAVVQPTSCLDISSEYRTKVQQSQPDACEGKGLPLEVSRTTATEKARVTHGEKARSVDSGLAEALNTLISMLDDYRGQFPELQRLEQKVKYLEEILLKQGVSRSRASSISLTVEHALESFDFLNTSDLEDGGSEGSEAETHQPDSIPYSSGACSKDSRIAEISTEDIWAFPISGGAPESMTTGSESLDRALVVHLTNCINLLLHLGTYGPLRCKEIYALDKLMREARVIEVIGKVSEEKAGVVNSAEEVLPPLESKHGAVTFWNQCSESSDVYIVSVETFLLKLNCIFGSQLPDKYLSLADTVCIRLAERVLEKKLPRRPRPDIKESITIFQYWSHLESEDIFVLENYMAELAEEVSLIQNLQSKDQDIVLKALKRTPQTRLQKDTIRAVSLLLLDDRTKVTSGATALLKSLAENPRLREKALVSCLELLEDESVESRVAGCKALACLKAKESIDQLVFLCQTDKESVRICAKQALLSFGEEGKLAYQLAEDTQDGIPRLFAPGSMASTAF